MITAIPHHFYSIIDPPNKKELLETFVNPNLHEDQSCEWNDGCLVKVEKLNIQNSIFKPSIDTFLEEINQYLFKLNTNILRMRIVEVWKNTYEKGYFQETHDHLPLHLSGVVFLTDEQEGDSRFFFHNHHSNEVSKAWREIGVSIDKHYIKAERGKVLLFPSYMLHGVTVHKTNNPRKTVAFNVEFNTSISFEHPY